MDDLNRLAAAGSDFRRYGAPRAGQWTAGEAFRWGFFAGFGMWLAGLVCTAALFAAAAVVGVKLMPEPPNFNPPTFPDHQTPAAAAPEPR